ncbi:MAG: alpha-L-arabinofuranosidase C-terminal domain-containing protein [Bacteroidales bacterium]|nr:alpha-L-arabinofuranosidase C-terminal domain-containing protein [Bacteroidales bacterium]
MKRFVLAINCLFVAISINAQKESTVTLQINDAKQVINKEIYGQFAEHLGSCIYGGLWVGKDSKIPNTQGYRNDVLQALKDIKVPVMRWPGGCFADEYHWMDGVGPQEKRPRMVNNNWGGTVEDNSFGTHEFLNLCELLGCEPYVSMNVGSGSVQETAQWVEYMTAKDGPMAKLRKQNGREQPWKVKYIGVGNESWGCGGNMRPEYYSDLYRRYATYCREYNGNSLYKIGSGASDYDYNWTETLMKQIGDQMKGLSLHYYTCYTWNGSKGSATNFSDDQYYWAIAKCGVGIEEVIKKQIAIMDQYDPKGKVDLLVDEWGTWWDEEPGSIRGHLYQQNTMRDAMVAAFSLNVFHQYTKRIKMTNIAQIANVLQSMVLTKDDKMVLTPTYHVFKMYTENMGATNIPLKVSCDQFIAENERYKTDGTPNRVSPYISASASKKSDGTVTINLANADLANSNKVTIDVSGIQGKVTNATILTSANVSDHNTFDNPNKVSTKEFKNAKISNGKLVVDMPKMSIVVLQIK